MTTRAQEVVIEVNGMTCEKCERHVADALLAVPGVVSARASRSEGQAVVTADISVATPVKLREAVAQAGYEARDLRFPE